MTDEEWRPPPGVWRFPYEVSTEGRIRNGNRILKGWKDQDGYLLVTLQSAMKPVKLRVHRLVCETFLGPEPTDKPHVLHSNGDPRDNRLENLRWGSPKENARDTLAHGRHAGANKTHCKRGHEYTPENIGKGNKGRRCLTCHRQDRTRSKGKRI